MVSNATPVLLFTTEPVAAVTFTVPPIVCAVVYVFVMVPLPTLMVPLFVTAPLSTIEPVPVAETVLVVAELSSVPLNVSVPAVVVIVLLFVTALSLMLGVLYYHNQLTPEEVAEIEAKAAAEKVAQEEAAKKR